MFAAHIHRLNYFFIAWFIIFIAACGGGGGGDTSSGGGESIYVGTYAGTFQITATGAGGTVSDSIAGAVIVESNGQLFFSTSGVGNGSSNCTDVPPTYLTGNTFSYSTNYSCTYPDLGTCTIQENGSGSITNNVLTYTANGTVSCAAGIVKVTVNFSGTKTATTSAVVASGNKPKIGTIAGSTARTGL